MTAVFTSIINEFMQIIQYWTRERKFFYMLYNLFFFIIGCAKRRSTVLAFSFFVFCLPNINRTLILHDESPCQANSIEPR